MIHGMSDLTQSHLYVTQINARPRIQFYRNCRINYVFGIFENWFEIENLKIGILKLKLED